MTLLQPDKDAPSAWHGDLPVPSRYTYGLAGERFFRILKDEGRIMGSQCPRDNRTYVPAVAFCERCLDELTDWRDMGLQGELHTFTVMYVGLDGKRLAAPEVVGFVRMGDGGIIHRIHADPAALRIGMKMQAVLKAVRAGSIEDIQGFEPA
jgi:hypothetical protein